MLIIRDDEKGINQFFTEMVQRREPDPPIAMEEGQAESVFIRLGNGGEGWKLTTSGIRRRIPAPVAHLQLQNMLVPFFSNGWGLCPTNHPSLLSLSHAGSPGGGSIISRQLLWEMVAPSDNQISCLGRVAGCQELRSETL